MKTDNDFKIGDWVTRDCECGTGDGIADELSINTAYKVINEIEGYLILQYFLAPVNPVYLRESTKKEIDESIARDKKYANHCNI